MTAALVAGGALVGAPLRYWLSRRLDSSTWPGGTLLVNVVGSLLLGVLAGLAVSGEALALFGSGFAGALTTYSSFAVQAHALGRRQGSWYAAVTLGLALTACFSGFCLGCWAGQA